MIHTPKFKILEASVFSRQIKTRMPFRFGRSNMTQMPVIHLKLTVATDSGRPVTGFSAAGIPPHWFDKSAGKSHADNVNDLTLSIRLALEKYLELDDAPVWFLHKIAAPATRKLATAKGLNDLTAGFGIALIDAALIDAACRSTATPFHAALQTDLFGLGPQWKKLLPAAPLDKIALRHTIGLSDPITASDVAKPLLDGLPETLEEVVRGYRAGYFKIKISADSRESNDRLRRISAVLDAQAGNYQVTLDGNEQFSDMEEFAAYLLEAARDPTLQNLWKRTLWIEQPVGRAHSLTASVAGPLKEINKFKPVIIDESDGDDETLDLALSLGYRGISAKNCKGVFRTLNSYRRIREAEAQGQPAPILSSEDLTNTPILSLQQDLCVAATLGITHSERNGHHYIVGFDFLSNKEKADALREFPSLYKSRPQGNPVVRIENGFLDVGELNRNGFGTLSEPDWNHMEPVMLPPVPGDIIEEKRSSL